MEMSPMGSGAVSTDSSGLSRVMRLLLGFLEFAKKLVGLGGSMSVGLTHGASWKRDLPVHFDPWEMDTPCLWAYVELGCVSLNSSHFSLPRS